MSKILKKYEASLLQGKNYTLQKRIIEKGTHYHPHWHDFFEFEIIIDGSGEHIYNNFQYTIEPGDAYLMSYRDFHALFAEDDITLMSLQFNGNVLTDEISSFLSMSYNRFRCRFNQAETEEILGYLHTIETETREKKIYSDIVIKNAIVSVIIKTIRKSNCTECGFMPSLVQQAVSYINNNFREDISLTELARRFSVTPNYLGKILTKWTGAGFSEYVNTARIKYACNLLTTTDLSVKEIAFSSGYNSVEHFIYVFKKKTADTPANYRKINLPREKLQHNEAILIE